ncbi:gliding motility-associated C-terminal domain-containing protein [Cyclobacterium lianum]|uniref:Gliding motility-associated C-terminal domain-containing protein n=1 Tax=Cyclobacterium lianum TaxID=388280 RepID=A0A1M7PWE3_9BACT|nr:T9SS type B sorting domain-containing protein [Cyclobacterium lianum]SHN21939.1 gliding motility-associated C-terminal domain-containing protein [Cyclobacterium lianum]
MIGNTNMTLLDYEEDLMNDGMMVYVDVDTDPETFNSSSATLIYSNENEATRNCTRVLFAGLYWSGRGPSHTIFEVTKDGVTRQFDKRKIKLKGPGQQEYVELQATDDEIRYPTSLTADLGLFVGYRDVTDLVRNWGEGDYTVADIGLVEGTNYHYGGWGMVVVYENPSMKRRDISVFDGYAFVRGQGAASYDIQVSGLSAIQKGDVNVKVGVMAGEGDVGADGDYFAIERGEGSNDFLRLSHGNNQVNNFFNSSIYTGGNPRNPELKNNTGMDISVFEIDNKGNAIIGNNQSNTQFRYGSTWDVYVIYNITMAIDATDVEVETFHELLSVNGNEVNGPKTNIFPGDELKIRATVRNRGDVTIDHSRIEIPLPDGLLFLDASPNLLVDQYNNGEFEFLAEAGAGGKIIWEMGHLPVTENKDEELAFVDYTLRVTDDCERLFAICEETFEIDGLLFGVNTLSQSPLDPTSFVSDTILSEECLSRNIKGPLAFDLDVNTYLAEKCGWDFQNLKIPVCASENDSVQVGDLYEYFPEGTLFFKNPPAGYDEPALDVDQYLSMDQDELSVYATPSLGKECFREIKLIRNTLSLVPWVNRKVDCQQVDENEIGVEVSGGIAPFSYLWNDATNSTSSTLTNVDAGEYKVIVTDALGCKIETSVILPDYPVFSLEILEEESILNLGCNQEADGNIVIAVEGENTPFVLSVSGQGNEGTALSEQIVIPSTGLHEISDLKGGIYTLDLEDLNGCTVRKTVEIIQIEQVDWEADFTFNSSSYSESGILYQDSEIQFFGNAGSGQNPMYFWDFGNGQHSTAQNPSMNYQESGHFLVRLQVTDENGCTAMYEEFLEISGFFIRVPTAFSPNGNNSNEYFFPVFSELTNIQFWVFNRWGELLYFTSDIHSRGWDGRHEGIEMPVGNYLYKITYSNKEVADSQLAGSFTLLR